MPPFYKYVYLVHFCLYFVSPRPSRPLLIHRFIYFLHRLFSGINAVEKEELLVVNVDGVKGGTNRNPVTSLSWATGVDNGTQVIVGWANHTVKIFSPQLGKFIKTEDRKCGDGALVSVAKHQG